jgi:hypothetical protein
MLRSPSGKDAPAHMRRALALAYSVSLLIGCAQDPKQVKITDANKEKILEEIKDMKGLTVDEARMLVVFTFRQGMGKTFGAVPPSVVGKTVGDIIAEEKAFETDAKKREEQQAKLGTEAKAKEDARAAELRKAISLTVFKKGFQEVEYQSYITISCAYENTSGKDVRAFTGKVRFTDLFGKPIYESNLTISNTIKAGDKGTWNGSIRYNKFDAVQAALRNSELADMKVEWLPASILFADGTKIGESAEK